ncbi:MAG: hypothetical protein HY758_05790, partial [Nitrospirae bacterium]|nr:hypothetical protein [Nitrospirota bacterium]
MKEGIVFIAPLGTKNKKAPVFETIISACPENDYSGVLYITPATFVQQEARRRFHSHLTDVHKKNSYIPFQSSVINDICVNLLETSCEEKIISDRARTLMLCEIIGNKQLGYAGVLSDLLGKIRHYIPDKDIAAIKDEIRSHIFEEKTMKRAVEAMETLARYEETLREKGLIDFESAIINSIPLIKEHVNQDIEQRSQASGVRQDFALIKAGMLVFDGFFDPTPLELKVIRALIERVDTTIALVEENAEFLKFFESFKQVFEKKRLKLSHRRENTGCYQYASMEDEVEGIAKKTKELILSGMMPSEIVVSFPIMSKYLPMLKRIFKKYGIPVDIANYNLSAAKPLIALEDMLSGIEDDYPRNAFISFLGSAYFPKLPAVLKEWAASFSGRAGIIKGRQAWLDIKEIILNSAEEDVTAEMKEALDEFQRGIKKVVEVLEGLRHQKDLSGFIDELDSVLERFGFNDSLEDSTSITFNDNVSRGIGKALSELRDFAQIYSLSGSSIGEMLSYLRYFLKGLSGSDNNKNGVRVLPFELAAGLESGITFFGGMIENDLPSRPDIDPILPEKVKKSLGLPFLEHYLYRQKRYFNRLLNSSSHDPYFSYPSADGDKIFLASPYLDWEMRVPPASLDMPADEEI